MKVAIYRIHYGLDFLKQSINSIIDHVDRVFVFHSKRPWSKRNSLHYLGQDIQLPTLQEDVKTFCEQFDERVVYICKQYDTPDNQYSELYSRVRAHFTTPTQTLMMEPDMVFAPGDVEKLLAYKGEYVSTSQIEFWKTMNWRVPQRSRVGATLWNVPVSNTHKGTYFNVNTHDSIQNYNFGFCLSKEIMLYKHLVAIMGSQDINDSVPDETWYNNKWLNWRPDMIDLEISKGHQHTIKQIQPYNPPANIMEYMNEFEN